MTSLTELEVNVDADVDELRAAVDDARDALDDLDDALARINAASVSVAVQDPTEQSDD